MRLKLMPIPNIDYIVKIQTRKEYTDTWEEYYSILVEASCIALNPPPSRRWSTKMLHRDEDPKLELIRVMNSVSQGVIHHARHMIWQGKQLSNKNPWIA